MWYENVFLLVTMSQVQLILLSCVVYIQNKKKCLIFVRENFSLCTFMDLKNPLKRLKSRQQDRKWRRYLERIYFK